MVLYDDKKWLCRLIRTAFTIEDDSGVCEKVLKQRPHLGDIVDNDSDSVSSDESFEIREGADMGHRRRSNTAIKLERLEKQHKAQTATQNVRVNPGEPIKNELVFVKDESYKSNISERNKQIVRVNKLLESVPHPDKVPYASFARFEASGQPSAPSKRMAVFLPFLPPNLRSYPLRVSVIATARVLDFIGLCLWMTSCNFPDVILYSVHQYSLQIADEDGEWDTDFPPLDHNEPVSKFSFTHLALVCSTSRIELTSPTTNVSFLIPNGTTYNVTVDDASIALGHLIQLVLSNSGWGSGGSVGIPADGLGYHLEMMGDPAIKFTDPSMPLSAAKCKNFCLVRDGAKSIQVKSDVPMQGTTNTSADFTGGSSDKYNVMVSTGRFNKIKKASCVIRGTERMELEYENNKIKRYPLSSITTVNFDSSKNRIVLRISGPSSSAMSQLGGSSHLTLTTPDFGTANELYYQLKSIVHPIK